jgi:peptide/nickel transport system substrate-binding protein
LDPAADYETSGLEVIQNVYQTLLFYNGSSTSDLVGVLATGYTVSPDGLNYTFYLRPNVIFSDGTVFNASAVKYTFDRGVIMNQGSWVVDVTPFLAGGAAYMASGQTPGDVAAYLANDPVQVINDTTVVFHLAQPYAAWPYVLALPGTSIISPSYDLANGGYKADDQSSWMSDHMCGTGPFVLTEWVPNDHITLTRNPDYWGTPALPGQVIIQYNDDFSAGLQAVDSGQADILESPSAMNYNDLMNDSNLKVDVNPASMQIDFIGMNLNRPPFNNSLVRQAFVESFDYSTYINNVLNGLAVQPNGPIPQGMPDYNASIPKDQYDPADAKQLLQEAGYNSSNPLNITLYYNNGNDARQTACLLLQQEIESYDPGYTVNIQALDWPTYLQMEASGQLPVYFMGWIADYPTADNFIGPLYLGTDQGYFAPQLGYNNSALNTLYLSALQDTNLTEQAQEYSQVITMGKSDHVYVFADQPYLLYAYRPDVQGIVENPLYAGFIYATMYKSSNPTPTPSPSPSPTVTPTPMPSPSPSPSPTVSPSPSPSPSPVPDSFTMDLNPGWNLISTPIENSSLWAGNISASGVDKVAYYNGSSQLFSTFLVGLSHANKNFPITPDTGYFVNCTNSILSLTVYGTMVDSPRTLYLYPGWNMVGWSSSSNMTAQDFGGLSGNITKIAGYNSQTGLYTTYLVGLSHSNRDFNMTRGNGYFVYSNATSLVSVNI